MVFIQISRKKDKFYFYRKVTKFNREAISMWKELIILFNNTKINNSKTSNIFKI